jgi:GNAT superfamily N-acetyltransferase
MAPQYTIRRMRENEVQLAIDWAQQEGWNPGLHDAGTFYQADQNGFFVGELDGEAIAVGSAVVYDEWFAFCGLYIVKPGYRGHGYGIQLTRARLEYVGERNAGIDGVVENIPIYERIGYRLAHHNERYGGQAVRKPFDARCIRPLSEVPFSLIETYDRHCFPAARSAFLHAWIAQADAEALGCLDNGRLKGFGVRRRCVEGHKIGPLFADDLEIAEHLFRALQQAVAGDPIYLDIPENNPQTKKLVESQAMELVFSTGRMYLRGQPDLADHKIFGITTFELG